MKFRSLSSISWAYGLQILNILYPFAIYFIYTYHYSADNLYGIIAVANAIISMSLLLFDWGFMFDTPRKMQIVDDYIIHLSIGVRTIMLIPFYIIALSLSLTSVISLSPSHVTLLTIAVFSSSLIPYWAFYTEMKYKQWFDVLVLNRGILILILLLLSAGIKQYLFAHIIANIVSILYSHRYIRYNFRSLDINHVFWGSIGKLSENIFLVSGQVFSNIYISGAPLLLGIFGVEYAQIGSYNILEKMARGIRLLLSPIVKYIYPILNNTKTRGVSFKILYIKSLSGVIMISVILTVLMLLLKDSIFGWLRIEEIVLLSNVFDLLSVLIVFGTISQFVNLNGIVLFERDKQMTLVFVLAVFIYVIAFYISQRNFGLKLESAAVAALSSEIVICLIGLGIVINEFVSKKH